MELKTAWPPTRTLFPFPAPSEIPPMASPEAQEVGAALAMENRVDLGAEETGAPTLPHQQSWLVRHFALLLRRDRQAQKAGQLFSGLLALNVVFLGSAFICSMIFNNVAITLGDVWILLAVLKALSLLWLLYYTASTTHRPHPVLHQDPHAGPIWVRGECWGTGWMEEWGGSSHSRGGANGHLACQAPWCSSAAAPSASTSSEWAMTSATSTASQNWSSSSLSLRSSSSASR